MRFSLNNVRLRGKMLILYFLCVLIPIVFTNLIFYFVTTNNVRNQKIHDIHLTMEQIGNEFRSQVDVAVGISSVLYTDSLLNEALEKDYDYPSDYVVSYNTIVNQTLSKYSPVYKAIKGVEIYTDNPSIIGGGNVLPIAGNVQEKDWYKMVMGTRGSTPVIVRTSSPTYNGEELSLSVIRRMDYFTYQQKYQKILKIDINLGAIQEIFHNLTLQGDVYLLGPDNRIVYTTNPSVDWRGADPSFDPSSVPRGILLFEQSYKNISYLQNWQIVGTVSEQEVLHYVHQSRNFVLYLAIPNIVIPTLIILWITRSLNVRIIRILKYMKKVKQQHFDQIPHEAYSDEIGQLTEEFNRMTQQIRRLIDEVYIADIQRKNLEIKRNQAQLHALQSQINPHFLFNALETIRMRSLMKQEKETAKIIHNMAKIFRKSLAWERDFVTINEELDLVYCFLEIQKYRFGDKLGYDVQVDLEAASCMIPKMTVLPFVENASIHGIEHLKGNGMIRLRIAREGDDIVCSVTDNGIGMSPEKLDQLTEDLGDEASMGDRIGIRNVYYRMKLYYGDSFHFAIESAPGQGTRVSIRLPAGRIGEAPEDAPNVPAVKI